MTEDPCADATAGKGLGVSLTLSISFCPIATGVIICEGTPFSLPCVCPGPIVYSDPHLYEEPEKSTECLVSASGANSDEGLVYESVPCLCGMLCTVNCSSCCARDRVTAYDSTAAYLVDAKEVPVSH